MSLHSKRIVVTRAPHQASALIHLLEARGAVAIRYPTIDIAPPAHNADLDAALQDVARFDWVIFTSSNTVAMIAMRCSALHIRPAFSTTKLVAIGTSTAQSLQEHFAQGADFIPAKQSGEGLLAEFDANGATIFLPQSEKADDTLAEGLREKGATVTAVVAYHNVIGNGGEDLPTLLASHEVDAFTFTSPSTVENLLKRLNVDQPPQLPAACIGPTTADAARTAGFETIIMPDTYALEPMIDALDVHFA